jgi:hypothetical protein
MIGYWLMPLEEALENRIDLLPCNLGSGLVSVHVDTIFGVRHPCHSRHRSDHARGVGACRCGSHRSDWYRSHLSDPKSSYAVKLADTWRCRRCLSPRRIHFCSHEVAMKPIRCD